MKKGFILLLCVFLLSTTGCRPADITTRQGLSLEQLEKIEPITFISAPTVIKRGEYATVSAKCSPGQLCAIAVHLSSGVSKAKGLEPAVSGENGIVTWTWKISAQTKPGEYRITVTCGGQAADTYFSIE